MKCMRCGREAYKSTTCETIEMEFGLLVIRNIPCYKCNECDVWLQNRKSCQRCNGCIFGNGELAEEKWSGKGC